MIILVTGGRDYKGSGRPLYDILDELLEQPGHHTIRHGDCRTGWDYKAKEYCDAFRVEEDPMPAEWTRWGRAAGPIRNQDMVNKRPRPDVCIVMPGGSGTNDCAEKAQRAGIRLIDRRIRPVGERFTGW